MSSKELTSKGQVRTPKAIDTSHYLEGHFDTVKENEALKSEVENLERENRELRKEIDIRITICNVLIKSMIKDGPSNTGML